MHSMWSDGRDSIEAMVAALPRARLRVHRHHRPLAALRRLPHADGRRRAAPGRGNRRGCASSIPDIAILHGCEVDILPDGRLDFPDAVLEQFDIVLASLHERAGHGPGPAAASATSTPCGIRWSRSSRIRPTGWCRTAPATIWTTTGCSRRPSRPARSSKSTARRRISTGRRAGAAGGRRRRHRVDRQRLPPRRHARPPDAARLTTARRGWVEPRHVLNTRPLEDVRAAHRRQARGALTSAAWLAAPSCRALIVAAVAFALYHATLLPGLRFRRHRLVPGDGRVAGRSRRATGIRSTSPSAARSSGSSAAIRRTRSTWPRRSRARPPAAARRWSAPELSGSVRGRRRRRAALCRVVHVLEPGGHRGGLRAPRDVRALASLWLLLRWADAPDARAASRSSSPCTRWASAITSR